MKNLIFLLLISCRLQAATYYVSTSGNDGNNGTSEGSAWKTIGKVNTMFSSFQPGDNILFKRGEVFFGTLTINKSGTTSAPIVIGAYNTGAQPIISGIVTPTGWTQSGNIWTSAAISNAPATVDVVLVNGIMTAQGRTPNAGFFRVDAFDAAGLTSSSIPVTTQNWTGAEVVRKRTHWILDRERITGHTGNTITHGGNHYFKEVGWGFFIQNHIKTLDKAGEWYFNPNTKQLSVYSATQPNTKVAVLRYLLTANSVVNVTVNNIDFEGADTAIYNNGSGGKNFVMNNCNVRYAYEGILSVRENAGTTINGGSANWTLNKAIEVAGSNGLIQNVTVRASGHLEGMGGSSDLQYYGVSIGANPYTKNNVTITPRGGIVQNCIVDSCGYAGIVIFGSDITVQKNFISNTNFVKDDAGGVYTYNGTNLAVSNRKILDNVIINSWGSTAGTNGGGPAGYGVYTDASDHIEVARNSIYNVTASAIYLNESHDINCHHNTMSKFGVSGIKAIQYNNVRVIHDLVVTNNIVANNKNCLQLQSPSTVNSFGTFNNNYYGSPVTTTVNRVDAAHGKDDLTLAQWRAESGQDLQTTGLLISGIVNFIYNGTQTARNFVLNGNYNDLPGATYTGNVNLSPYTSKILINGGIITPPDDGGGPPPPPPPPLPTDVPGTIRVKTKYKVLNALP